DPTTKCTSSTPLTVKVNPLPDCSFSGPTTACAGSSDNTYTATATTGVSYLWSVTGNGTISGSNAGSSVTVMAGSGGSYTVSLQVTDNTTLCVNNSCSQQVTVNSCAASCTLTIGGYRNHFAGLISILTNGNGLTLGG